MLRLQPLDQVYRNLGFTKSQFHRLYKLCIQSKFYRSQADCQILLQKYEFLSHWLLPECKSQLTTESAPNLIVEFMLREVSYIGFGFSPFEKKYCLGILVLLFAWYQEECNFSPHANRHLELSSFIDSLHITKKQYNTVLKNLSLTPQH